MPGHVTATYGHSVQFLAKRHGKPSPRIARAIHKNIVKNSKKRRLFWSGVAETRWFFPFPLIFTYTQAFCSVRQAGERKHGRIRRWGVGRLSITLSTIFAGPKIGNAPKHGGILHFSLYQRSSTVVGRQLPSGEVLERRKYYPSP